MSNIEKFYTYVAQNPALLSKLVAGAQSPDAFIDRAVAAASEQGLAITRGEAKAWIDEQIEARQNGELSDVQLEAVAGGKSGTTKGGKGGTGTSGNFFPPSINNPLQSVSHSVENWFSSW
ncbi:MAG: Nif11-like leader peptide family natural product precursor [Pseudomonadota bacterium]